MIIYFVEAERAGEEFFARELAEHDLCFVDTLEDVGAEAEVVSGFINASIKADFLIEHPALQLIATRSQATDHIDVAACRERGIQVANVPDYGDTTVAEHTFALILAISRRLRELMVKSKDKRFSYERGRAFDLAGKTIGIIGMGRIGQRVATLSQAFQMTVVASELRETPGVTQTRNVEFVPQDELLARSHIISLHAPLTPETYHLINRDSLARCRPGVVIINTARGSLIDTAALVEGLESGHVGGAGLDVLQDERVLRESASAIIAGGIVSHLRSDALAHEDRDADRLREVQELMLSDAVLSRTNVVFTPHVAFNSEEAVERLREGTVENIRSFVAGRPTNLVGHSAES